MSRALRTHRGDSAGGGTLRRPGLRSAPSLLLRRRRAVSARTRRRSRRWATRDSRWGEKRDTPGGAETQVRQRPATEDKKWTPPLTSAGKNSTTARSCSRIRIISVRVLAPVRSGRAAASSWSGDPGGTMNWAPARATFRTSVAVVTVPAPTPDPWDLGRDSLDGRQAGRGTQTDLDDTDSTAGPRPGLGEPPAGHRR